MRPAAVPPATLPEPLAVFEENKPRIVFFDEVKPVSRAALCRHGLDAAMQ
jgi:hypothetical protein